MVISLKVYYYFERHSFYQVIKFKLYLSQIKKINKQLGFNHDSGIVKCKARYV